MSKNKPAPNPAPAKRDISRIVPDTSALKALAHAGRLRMLGLLRLEGPATATQLASRLGLNSGSTSYHLRQLARHGFVEPADDLGDKRDRWWRASHESTFFDTSDLTGDDLESGMAMTQAVISQHAASMQRAHEQFPDQPAEWRRASTASDYTFNLTAVQAQALVEKIETLLWEAKREAPAPDQPLDPGMKPFTVLLHAFPFPGIPGAGPKDDVK